MRLGSTTKGRASDRRAEFERFVQDRSAALLRTAYLLVGELAEAEDLVQECLLVVAGRWPRVRRMEHPHGYARRILVNLALRGGAARSRRRLELGDDHDSAAADVPDDAATRALENVDVRDQLIAALGALPPRQRAILVLRYLEDLSEAQVAEALGCSLGTVKSSSSRGLARLQAQLAPHHHPLTTKESA